MTRETAPYPGSSTDPVAYVAAAAAYLADLEVSSGDDAFALLIVAQRLAVIALDREATIIGLRNKLAELELELEAASRADHPTFPRRLRYITGGTAS
jgi:hypothetical protein